MKSLELLPSKENLLNTFLEDKINRSDDVIKFAELLSSIEGCFSIAVDSQWGSGKTFFVKQVKLVLDACNDSLEGNLTSEERDRIKNYLQAKDEQRYALLNSTPQVCIYYDAWANDNDVDPITSIVYEIAKSTSCGIMSVNQDYREIISSLLIYFTGNSTERILDAISGHLTTEPIASQKDVNGHSITEPIASQKDVFEEVNKFFNSFIDSGGDHKNKGRRMVIIIDELDRCRPTYSVKLLERIKHYFLNDNITFVFSINSLSLQHTIKKYYGGEFDSTRYMDRFFDISMSLPPLDHNLFMDLLGTRSQNGAFERNRLRILKSYSFTMREIMRYYKLTNAAINKLDFRMDATGDASKWALYFSFNILLPVAAGLKMRNVKDYYDFIEGNKCEPLLSELTNDESIYDLCECLLSDGEAFKPIDRRKYHVVKIADKIQEVYYAVFRERYDNVGKRTIGRAEFTRETKESFMRALSVLSEYSDYD